MTVFVISCRDGLFAKDGRGWFTSASGRAHGLAWPFPSTLLGAMRTAWGRQQEHAHCRVFTKQEWEGALNITLGATVTLRRSVSGPERVADCRIWPVPLDALFMPKPQEGGEAEIIRLDPVKVAVPTLGRDETPAREALWRPALTDPRKPDPRPSWWPEEVFVDWLAKPADRRKREERDKGFRPEQRFQVHVGIDPSTGAAKEQILFAHEVIEALDEERMEWMLACEVHGWKDPPSSLIASLGGDRRPARMRIAEEDLLQAPDRLQDAFDQEKPHGVRLVTVTPMASAEGWLPQELAEQGNEYRGQLPGIAEPVLLRAAFVGRPQHVSGWDMAEDAPKRTVRLVPPGSVYHLVKVSGSPFTGSEARPLWLAALGQKTEEGFGRVVPGLWHPKER